MIVDQFQDRNSIIKYARASLKSALRVVEPGRSGRPKEKNAEILEHSRKAVA